MLKSLSILRRERANQNLLWAAVRARFSACSGVAVKCLFQPRSLFPCSFYLEIEPKNVMYIKMLCLSDGVHFYSGTILLTDRYAFGAEIGPVQELCISFAPLHQCMNYWASTLASFHYFQISDMSKMTHLTFYVTNLFQKEHYYITLYTWVPQPPTQI